MEEQISVSQPPMSMPPQLENQITPEQLAEMKARARELAIQQTIAQQAAMQQQQPRVIYLRRNLTVAEVLLVLLLSCGIVTGIQWSWNALSNVLPRVEIKVR
ncbi:MAG: hypothetical protein ACK5F0_12310 [Flavobacteriales bacterium]|jgi:hypothetical protein